VPFATIVKPREWAAAPNLPDYRAARDCSVPEVLKIALAQATRDEGVVADLLVCPVHLEYGSRLRDHQRKLSTRLLEIADVVTEASFWAGKTGRELVRKYRSSLVEELVREQITAARSRSTPRVSAWAFAARSQCSILFASSTSWAGVSSG
jgi:hypothetical protein